jgi:hypothetical protein
MFGVHPHLLNITAPLLWLLSVTESIALPPNWDTLMPRFYFHRRLNGELSRDLRGLLFDNIETACAHAVHRTPTRLSKSLRSTANTYISTEVSNGERILRVVRGSVVIERR